MESTVSEPAVTGEKKSFGIKIISEVVEHNNYGVN